MNCAGASPLSNKTVGSRQQPVGRKWLFDERHALSQKLRQFFKIRVVQSVQPRSADDQNRQARAQSDYLASGLYAGQSRPEINVTYQEVERGLRATSPHGF